MRHQIEKLICKNYCIGPIERIKIGHHVSLVNIIFDTLSGNIIIEDHCFLGFNVSLLAGTHDISQKFSKRKMVTKSGCDIIIHQGTWVASNVTIIGPCTIGEFAVIGAGSIVVKDVEPGCLYAGNPAKFIKKINFTGEKL